MPAKKPKSNTVSDADTVTLDFGYGAVPPDYGNISYSGGVDTITIDTSNMYSSNTITLPSSSNTFTYGGATVGGITTINNVSNNSQWTTGTSGYQFNTTPNTVHINSTGIEMAAGTDIKVDGKSLKEFMNKMEERLAILVPDPKKLEQFAALKKAYEHYKLMEKLCQEPPKEEA
jgi:hypothetical protein